MKFRQISLAAAVGLSLLQAACGGGGGGSTSPATTLPTVVSIDKPASADVGAPASFSNSAASLPGLKFQWQFGDGSGSNEAAPKHQYAKAGDYQVTLTVSDANGQSREAVLTVSVGNTAALSGVVCSKGGRAGWCQMGPQPAGHATQISFASVQQGLVLKDEQLFLSADAGQTWKLAPLAGAGPLHRARASADGKTVLVIGRDARVWRSLDGGATFAQAGSFPAPSSLGNALLRQAGSAFDLVDASGMRWVSSDRGEHWVASDADIHLVRTDGTAFGMDEAGMVWASSDLGLTRRTVGQLPADCMPLGRARISAATGSRLIAAGWSQVTGSPTVQPITETQQAVLCTSEDEGSHWTRLLAADAPRRSWWLYHETPPELQIVPTQEGWLAMVYSPYSYQLSALESGASRWQARGDGPYPKGLRANEQGQLVILSKDGFLASGDAGRSWTPLALGGYALQGAKIWSPLAGLGWADSAVRFGPEGLEWISPGGQASGLAQPYGVGPSFLSPAQAAPGRLMAFQGSLLVNSDDMGRHWTPVLSLPNASDDFSLQFIGTTGWFVSGEGEVWRSSDAGINWSKVYAFNNAYPYLTRIHFRDERNGAALVMDLAGISRVYDTQDGGGSWSVRVQAPQESTELRLTDAGDVLVVNGSGLHRHRAGRPAFEQLLSASGLHLLKAQAGGRWWVAGESGALFTSADGGQTWQPRSSGGTVAITALGFADEKSGWAAADAGKVLVTRDGGQSWTPQVLGTSMQAKDLLVLDSKTVLLFGSEVLATGTGGD